ncbi:hypothetical protein AFK68_24140 [Hydrocoleum sp. CS-953]|nr:hypothetical protein AFK68_24140 [Hydrocoleum sp. CS-953]
MAVDKSNHRVVNIHLPWSNSHIYFDCGNTTTSDDSYDRIEKLSQAVDFKDKWTYWVFTKNVATGEMNIYLNGTLWQSGTGKNQPISSISQVKFGDGYGFYNGKVANLRIYDRVLSPEEINELMQVDKPDAGDTTSTTGADDATPTTDAGDTTSTTGAGDATPTTDATETASTTGAGDATPTTETTETASTTGADDATPTTETTETASTTGAHQLLVRMMQLQPLRQQKPHQLLVRMMQLQRLMQQKPHQLLVRMQQTHHQLLNQLTQLKNPWNIRFIK